MKTLSKRIASSMIAFAATLALGVAMSSPVSAATTYTPGGGPKVNLVGSNISFRFVQSNLTINCPTFNLAGSVVNPGTSRAYGANGVVVSTLTSSGCTNSIMGAVGVTMMATWGATVTGDAVGTTWPMKLTGITASFSSSGCAFKIGGNLMGTFSTATQKFTPGASTIKIVDVPAGFLCPLLGLGLGQDVVVSGTWTNTPPVGSGPLTIANP